MDKSLEKQIIGTLYLYMLSHYKKAQSCGCKPCVLDYKDMKQWFMGKYDRLPQVEIDDRQYTTDDDWAKHLEDYLEDDDGLYNT